MGTRDNIQLLEAVWETHAHAVAVLEYLDTEESRARHVDTYRNFPPVLGMPSLTEQERIAFQHAASERYRELPRQTDSYPSAETTRGPVLSDVTGPALCTGWYGRRDGAAETVVLRSVYSGILHRSERPQKEATPMTAFTFTTCARPQGGWAILADGKVMPLICETQEQAQAIILTVIEYHVRRAKAASSGMINAARDEAESVARTLTTRYNGHEKPTTPETKQM